MKHILFVFLLLISVLTESAGQVWQTLEPVNSCTERHENGLTAIGNSLVLAGGRGIKAVETFDLRTRTWTKHAETPLEMHHFQAISFQNELWVLGAFTGKYPHETPIPDIYIFNVKKNEWRKGPEIPADRRRGAAGVFTRNNKVYLVCGIQDGHWDGHVGWFDEYDPKSGTWKKLPDAPHVRDHVHAAVLDDKLYVAGGRRSTAKIGQVLNLTEPSVDVYDFKTGKWSTLKNDLPTQRAGASSVVMGKKLLVIGGESGSQVPSHSEVEAYNPGTQQWEKLPPLTTGRHGTGAVQVQGRIYTVAGSGNRGGGPELSSIEVLSPR